MYDTQGCIYVRQGHRVQFQIRYSYWKQTGSVQWLQASAVKGLNSNPSSSCFGCISLDGSLYGAISLWEYLKSVHGKCVFWKKKKTMSGSQLFFCWNRLTSSFSFFQELCEVPVYKQRGPKFYPASVRSSDIPGPLVTIHTSQCAYGKIPWDHATEQLKNNPGLQPDGMKWSKQVGPMDRSIFLQPCVTELKHKTKKTLPGQKKEKLEAQKGRFSH